MAKWQDAKVRWFDKLSGIGMVRLDNGESVYLHYFSFRDLLTPNKPRAFWPSDYTWSFELENDTPVKVQVIEDYNWKQVSKLKPN